MVVYLAAEPSARGLKSEQDTRSARTQIGG